jgi:hypothetical protein
VQHWLIDASVGGECFILLIIASFGYFKNLKKPMVFMKELTKNQHWGRVGELFEFFKKIKNHAYI